MTFICGAKLALRWRRLDRRIVLRLMVLAEARRLDLRRLVRRDFRRDFFVTLAMKHFRFPLALKQTFLFLERATILFK